MARVWVEDLWFSDKRDVDGKRTRTRRHGQGSQWRVRWYDLRRRPKAKSFATKRDAEAWQAKIEQELRGGTYTDRALGRAEFGLVAAEWLTVRTDIERSSVRTYEWALTVHILPAWSDIPVDAIRRHEVGVWLAKLGGRLSPASVTGVYRVLSMVLKWAVETGRIAANPAARLPLPRATTKDHVFLSHGEVADLAKVAGMYRTLVLTLAYTGLRFGEASALTTGSVDLVARRIAISQAWAASNSEAPYLSTPKNHERRRVGLPDFLAAELQGEVAERAPDEWLFTSPNGRAINLPNWRRRHFNPAVEAAGLSGRGITPHSLRHTAASLAIAAGADVKVVQNMLGHKDATETLNTYAGLFPDRLDEVATALDVARSSALRANLTGPTRRPD
jgi:integrase